MKPFDLEAAKRGEPIQTRGGRPVNFIAHVPEAEESDRIVVLEAGFVAGMSERSVFMVPSTCTLWLNVYVSDGRYTVGVFPTKENAEKAYLEGPIATRVGNRAWPLEIEE